MKVYKEFIVQPHLEASLITEAFGIDSGYKNIVVDNLEIPDDYEILYITGESGSGKSTILKEMSEISHCNIPNTPLFKWHDNPQKALEILTLVGLGDAVLFLSYYNMLSDSQKARARIALELLSDKDEIIIDEFLSTLDRKTAKSVAFCIQKAIRKLGKKAIFVTAHDDLEEYIKPTYIIRGKSFPSRWTINEGGSYMDNPILNQCSFEYVDKVFYRNLRLGELHYKGKYTGGTKEYLSVMLDGECIGILVSTFRMHDRGRRISRVVIHPSYRGCGVGTKLIKEYLTDYEGVDVVASMAKFNPVFERAGMTKVEDSDIKSPPKLKKELKSIGFNIDRWYSRKYCSEFAEDENNRKVISKYAKCAAHLVTPGGNNLEVEEIVYKIQTEIDTASRVLWSLRDRTMAKFVHK